MDFLRNNFPLVSSLSGFLFFGAYSGIAFAQQAEIETLKRQLGEMQKQIDKMAEPKRNPQAGPQRATAGAASSAFNPAISVNGLFLGGYSSSPRRTAELSGLDFHNGFNFQEAE